MRHTGLSTAAPGVRADGRRPHVVVVGGGFGGLRVVDGLRRAAVDVTLVDERNFHLFQPLTYQVATGALDPGQVAYPLRALFASARNVDVALGRVEGFDLAAHVVHVATDDGGREIAYDTLVVAAGSTYAYFGHEDWRPFAIEVKTLENALAVRSRLIAAFERAEQAADPREIPALLTFVVVGGGPTGVEMAGQIAELAKDTLRGNFRRIDPTHARVVLVEAGERLLAGFAPALSARAERSLTHLGATTMTRSTVVDVDADGVAVADADGSRTRIDARTVVWAAGVQASALAADLATAVGQTTDHAGRITVGADLTLAGHPEVLVLGDMARVRDADGGVQPLPGVAPVAMQQGRYAARLIRARLRGKTIAPFHYHDKGNLATIGRGSAVAEMGRLHFGGFVAWVLWLVVHLWYLIGFQNRLLVVTRWAFSFVTHGRGTRIITQQTPAADVAGARSQGGPS